MLDESLAEVPALLRDSLFLRDSLETAESEVLLLRDSLFLMEAVLSDKEVLSDSEAERMEAEMLLLSEADAARAEVLEEASEALVLSFVFMLWEEAADAEAEVLIDSETDPEIALREAFSSARDSEAEIEEDAALIAKEKQNLRKHRFLKRWQISEKMPGLH